MLDTLTRDSETLQTGGHHGSMPPVPIPPRVGGALQAGDGTSIPPSNPFQDMMAKMFMRQGRVTSTGGHEESMPVFPLNLQIQNITDFQLGAGTQDHTDAGSWSLSQYQRNARLQDQDRASAQADTGAHADTIAQASRGVTELGRGVANEAKIVYQSNLCVVDVTIEAVVFLLCSNPYEDAQHLIGAKISLGEPDPPILAKVEGWARQAGFVVAVAVILPRTITMTHWVDRMGLALTQFVHRDEIQFSDYSLLPAGQKRAFSIGLDDFEVWHRIET